jgi:hypothetical protein
MSFGVSGAGHWSDCLHLGWVRLDDSSSYQVPQELHFLDGKGTLLSVDMELLLLQVGSSTLARSVRCCSREALKTRMSSR